MVTVKEAKETSKHIVDTIRPVAIILFGSVARNGFGEDLDLLIIIDDRFENVNKTHLMLHSCLKDYYRNFAIDPFVVTLSSLNEYYFKSSPFLRMIAKEGRTLYMKNAVKEWVEHSKEELDIAEYLLKGEFYRGTCYHAQQCIEKAIKAALLNKGWDLEKTHNI